MADTVSADSGKKSKDNSRSPLICAVLALSITLGCIALGGCASSPMASKADLLQPAQHAGGARCGPRHDVLEGLSRRYQESIVWRGVTSRGALLEITNSPAGSWTVLVTVPGGLVCLVSSGERGRVLPVDLGPGDSGPAKGPMV